MDRNIGADQFAYSIPGFDLSQITKGPRSSGEQYLAEGKALLIQREERNRKRQQTAIQTKQHEKSRKKMGLVFYAGYSIFVLSVVVIIGCLFGSVYWYFDESRSIFFSAFFITAVGSSITFGLFGVALFSCAMHWRNMNLT